MAVTSQTPSITFTANGSTTDFAFNFVVPATDTTGTITDSTADMSNGSAVLTVDTANLFYTSTLQGKAITVTGAGVSSADLTTTILSVDSATQITLNASASTAVTNTNISITTGTFNTTLKTNSDLLVFVDGTQQTITTHYTVRLNLGDDANKSGTVIFGSAPANGAKVVVLRDVTLQRTTDFQTGGALTAKSLNAQFDTMIMAVQDTQFDTAASAVKFPSDETLSTTTLPASTSRANKVLGFNGSGEILMRDDLTTGTAAITGSVLKGTTSLQTPLIEYTDGDDAITIADGGAVTIANLTATTTDINGGAIDGTTIGASSHSTGKFTTLTSTGATVLQGLTYPTSDGTNEQVLSTNGSGTLTFRSIAGLSLFTALTDTPANYTDAGNKYVKVNSGATGLEYDDTVVTTTNTKTLTNKTLTSPAITGTLTGDAFLDEDDMASDSATKVASQQSIKKYVDDRILTEDTLAEMNDVNLTSPADASLLLYDTGTSKWIDNVMSGDATLADTGALTIAANAVEGSMLNTDVVSAQTELASGLASTDEIMVSDAGVLKRMDVAVLTGYNASLSETLTNKTLTSPVLNTGVSGTAIKDEDNMSSDSATHLATQQSIKAYVDSQVTAQDLDATTDSGTIDIDLDSETLTVAGGEGIDTSATGTTITIAGEDASTSNKGIASFSSDHFSVSSGAVSLKADGIDDTHIDFGTGTNQVSTADIPEQTNLYYTDARAQAVSINNVVEDTTPQLGGNLDVNGQSIVTASNGNIVLAPNGSGEVRINGADVVEHHNANGIIITGGNQGTYTKADWSTKGMLFNTGVHVEGNGQWDYPALVLKNNSDNGYPNLWAAKARPNGGDYTSDTYLQDGDIMFKFFGAGYQGTYSSGESKFSNGSATVDLYATEDHSATAGGGGIKFKTLNTGVAHNGTATTKLEISDEVVVNPGNVDINFRVDGDTNNNVFFVDAGNDRVGVKTNSPSTDFEVNGSGKFTALESTGTTTANLFSGSGASLTNLPSNSLTGNITSTSSDVKINDANGDVDFMVGGDANDNIFYVNAGTEKVGIKTNSPSYDFDVNGNLRATTLYGDGSNLNIDLNDLDNVDTTGYYLTLNVAKSLSAGETITQANSGATGKVKDATTSHLNVQLINTTGTFTTNTSDLLTGSTTGALNTYATAVEYRGASATYPYVKWDGTSFVMGSQTLTSNTLGADLDVNSNDIHGAKDIDDFGIGSVTPDITLTAGDIQTVETTNASSYYKDKTYYLDTPDIGGGAITATANGITFNFDAKSNLVVQQLILNGNINAKRGDRIYQTYQASPGSTYTNGGFGYIAEDVVNSHIVPVTSTGTWLIDRDYVEADGSTAGFQMVMDQLDGSASTVYSYPGFADARAMSQHVDSIGSTTDLLTGMATNRNELKSSIKFGVSPSNTDFANEYDQSNAQFKYEERLAEAYPTITFANGEIGSQRTRKFGGLITTETAGVSGSTDYYNADLILGAFPIANNDRKGVTEVNSEVLGVTKIYAGGKADGTQYRAQRFGADSEYKYVEMKYPNREVVSFESPASGTTKYRTLTLDSATTLGAGTHIRQRNSGAVGVVKTSASSSTSVQISGIIGTFTTNASDILEKPNGSGGATSLAVYPTAVSSEAGGIADSGARATFKEAVVLGNKTSTERDAYTATNGMILYNETTNKFQGYANGSWVDLH